MNMTNEEIIGKINDMLTEEFEVDASVITPEAPLKETLELDSLDYVDMVVLLEGNLGFKVKQEDFMSLRTFQHLYDYAIGKVRQTASV
jgi:acyl carrier protein